MRARSPYRNITNKQKVSQGIGILKQIMLDCGIDPESIIFQSPADAKAMFDNPKLKKLEYWHKGGEGHALDAIRHGLLRCVKLGWKPLRLLQ